ncbi:hypothetical protein KY284_008146 [Solanum tuberosum]|nr:hypothetical protein KY284_008146 [Solanum tuberosum]
MEDQHRLKALVDGSVREAITPFEKELAEIRAMLLERKQGFVSSQKVLNLLKAVWKKLRQVTRISKLQGRFEAIANETDDISDGLMVRLFVSGLREDIKNSVFSHEPKTYDDTLKWVYIHERRIKAEKGTNRVAFANRGAPLLPSPN